MVLCCEMLRKPSRGYGGGLVKLVRLAWMVVVGKGGLEEG